ncbi:MAG: ABC transporter permease, partial [Candidatus Bathyarchaeia archaeon]
KSQLIAQAALARTRDLYMSTRIAFEDASNAITFASFILIPFAIFAERLFVQQTGLRRLISILLFYMVPLAVLWPLHPGFGLASNALMVLVGFSVLVLLAPPTGIVAFIAGDTMKKLRTQTFGVHLAELPRSSVALIAFSTGIRNMRKRPLRTGLLLTSIIIISAASVVFTSTAAVSVVKPVVLRHPGRYDGILVRQYDWGGLLGADPHSRGPYYSQIPPQVGDRLYEELKLHYGDMAVLSPRSWAYVGRPTLQPVYTTNEDGVAFRTPTHALLGLSPQEKEILIDESRDMTAGRWFTDADNDERRDVAIISSVMADGLGITKDQVESTSPPVITWAGGYDFTVVGITNDTTIYQEAIDLDNLAITPFDIKALPALNIMVLPEETVILPYKTLLKSVDGFMVSCAMKLKPEYATQENVLRLATEIYEDTKIDLWASFDGQVFSVSRQTVVNLRGWDFQMVPLVLAALTILNLLIGSVQERMNEIQTYSVVGLSPFHTSFMFLAETLSYAVVGNMIGYVIGIAAGYWGNKIDLGIVLNYYGTQVVFTIVVIMAMTVVASLYPMLRVSRLVTPSLERRWRLPKAMGNEWRIPLPFVIAGEGEAVGMTNYLLELVDAHKVPDSEIFRTSNLRYEESETPEQAISDIKFESQLEPYELNIFQDVSLRIIKEKATDTRTVELCLVLTRGSRSSWEMAGRGFIDLFRKQFLLWRSFSVEEREAYQKKFEKGRFVENE